MEDPREGSGAAIIFADDDLRRHEYDTTGLNWVIGKSDNYAAELSAICLAIRAIPCTVDLTIHTDSLSAKQAIAQYLRSNGVTPPLHYRALEGHT
jgi:ribonuclease HI